MCQDVLGCNTILVIHHTNCECSSGGAAAGVMHALRRPGQGARGACMRVAGSGCQPAATAGISHHALSPPYPPSTAPAGGAHAALYHPSAVVEHTKAKIDEALGTNLGGEAVNCACTSHCTCSAQLPPGSDAPCTQLITAHDSSLP